MSYRIMRDGTIIDERKRRFDLVESGLDRAAAALLSTSARVVEGNFPRSEEITGDRKRIDQALGNLASERTLFSYVASHYRGYGVDILFLDYCH